MSLRARLLAVLLCTSMLFGCAQHAGDPEDIPASRSVTVETFGSTLQSEATTTSETISEPDIITAPSASADPETTTERSYKTDAPTTAKENTTASQSESYQVIDINVKMKASSSVNVRVLPDADSERVGHLDKGEEVTATGRVSNGWVRIIYKGEERYVNGNYLTESSAATTVTTTAATTTTPAATTTLPTTTTAPTTTAPPKTTTEPTTTEEPFETEELEILTTPNSYSALNYSTQKAVWFAYLDIDEMLKNASKSDFTSKIGKAFDEVRDLGCNTVYVHVRSFGDAYYYSSLFPFTAAYSDTLGVKPSYDPLEIMISEAHSRGLSFHAWINPMRTTSKDRYAEMDSSYTLKQWYNSDSTNGTFMVYDKSTGFWWLSPAYPAVRALICNGVSEIVSNYNVDGIHIDDYFYPTTSSSFDQAAFEASGAKDRASWRRSVVNSLVKELYNTVKACNSTVEFGVSPQGNIENNTDQQYADVATWCSTSGYLDYIVPQIYYGFNDKLSFDTAAKQWEALVTAPNVRLICGIAAYKVGVNNEWSSGEILKKQTDYISDMGSYSGVAYYRHGSLYGIASSSTSLMKTELTSLKRSISEF